MATTDESNELEETFAAIEKRYGSPGHKVRTTGSGIRQPARISTGSFVLDFALLGGIPAGRITGLIGNKGSGKSMIAAKIAGYCQRMERYEGQRVVWIDAEKAFDPTWARKLGCDISQLEIVEPDTAEMAVDIADAVMQSKETSLIIIDSLAGLNPSKEMEDSAEDANVALQARLIGRLMRKMNHGMLKERLRGHEASVLCINQYRTKIGVMFGDPRTAPGGQAWEYFPSCIIQMKNKEKLGKDADYDIEHVVENEHAFRIEKWRGNNGPRTGEFRVNRMDLPQRFLAEGDVDDAKTMLTFAKKFGVYTGGGGSWKLEFAGYEHKVKNIEEAVLFLNENREWYWSLYNYLIREQAIRLDMDDEFIGRFEV